MIETTSQAAVDRAEQQAEYIRSFLKEAVKVCGVKNPDWMTDPMLVNILRSSPKSPLTPLFREAREGPATEEAAEAVPRLHSSGRPALPGALSKHGTGCPGNDTSGGGKKPGQPEGER